MTISQVRSLSLVDSWKGVTHQNPLVVFFYGTKSLEITKSLGEIFQARVIKQEEKKFKQVLLEGIENRFNVFVHVSDEKFNPKNFDETLVKQIKNLGTLISIFFHVTSIEKMGYDFTVQPYLQHGKIFLHRLFELQKMGDQKPFFRLLAERLPRFQELQKKVVSRFTLGSYHTFFEQFSILSTLNLEEFDPQMRPYFEGVDFNEVHRPYPFNEFVLPDGRKTSASHIEGKVLDEGCPNFIATGFPKNGRAALFWSMVHSLPSTCLVQLNSGLGSCIPETKEEVVEFEDCKITLLNKETLLADRESLIKSTFLLNKGG